MMDVICHSDVKIGEHPKLHKYILKIEGNENTSSAAMVAQATKSSSEAYLAYAFIAGANHKKYAKLMEDLSNTYHCGKDKYPNTFGAHKLLTSWENKSNISYG
eukprot:3220327-Ditylum_brightwellii.AAC.1